MDDKNTTPARDGAPVLNGTLKLSTGVILRIHGFARSIMWEIQSGFDVPRPPVVFLKEKGREEENPEHPAYLAAMEKYTLDVAKALTDTAFILGTEIESVPDELQRPEDLAWQKLLRKHKVKIGDEPDDVYLAWLRHVAAPDEKDIIAIREAVSQHIGVAESDVQSVVSWFRREAGRSAD